MSTKTTIKRVALVAAVALTLGGFSAVSASAAAVSTIAQVAGTGDHGAGGIAGPANTLKFVVTNGSGVGTSDLAEYVTVTGGTITSATDTTTVVAASGASAVVAKKNVVTGGNTTGSDTFTVTTPTVGSIVINVYDETSAGSGLYASTPSSTKTITVSATSVVGTASAANSTSYIQVGAAPSSTPSTSAALTVSADSTTAVSKTNSAVGFIKVTLKDTQSPTPAAIGSAALTASISGSGLIAGDNTDASAFSTAARVAIAYTDTTTGVAVFEVLGDGTAGTGTITISSGSTVISTETVNFYNTTPAAFSVTQNLFVGASGVALGYTGTNAAATYETNTAAVTLVAKDSAGNLVGGLASTGTWSWTSSNTADIASTGSVVVTEDTANNGAGYYNVQPTFAATAASGDKVTVTLKWTSADLATVITAAPVTFSVGGTTVYGATLKFAADSYNVGDKTTMTITATDKSGNPIADGNYSLFGNNFAGLTTSAQLTSSVFAYVGGPSILFVNGKATSGSFYVPVSSGPLTVSGALGTTVTSAALQTAATVLSATTTVAGGADASLAVDAANAATDAANAAAEEASNATEAASEALAAVNALATTVASLIAGIKAQLTALTALVKKLQK